MSQTNLNSLFLLRILLLLCFIYLCHCQPTSVNSTAAAVHATSPGQDLNGGENHRSHAVPGGPYVAYDHTGTGKAIVHINGGRSHSHFYNPKTNVQGVIVSFNWVLKSSKKTICITDTCNIALPIGRHSLTLHVRDQTGDKSQSETIVTVLDGGKPGIRFLYYRGIGNLPDKLNPRVKADISETTPTISHFGPLKFIRASLEKPLSIRVFGEFDISEKGQYVLKLDCGSASCSFYIDGKIVLASSVGERSVIRFFKAEEYKIYICWRMKKPFKIGMAPPRLIFRWMPPNSNDFKLIPKSVISHRPGSIQPVVHAVSPTSILTDSTLTVKGSGFIPGTRVKIGKDDCKGVKLRSQFQLTCEVNAAPGTFQNVLVQSPHGGRWSNVRKLQILTRGGATRPPGSLTSTGGGGADGEGNSGSIPPQKRGVGYEQRVKFSEGKIRKNGREWRLRQATSIVRGPDDRYYFGTRSGRIIVAEISGDSVNEVCTSSSMGQRSVLGLAFNPADKVFKMYATSCITFFSKNKIPVSSGWKNGEINIFEKSGNCIKKTRTIISGIPVSAIDHGVNKLAFDNNGVLYFTVGSNTNAGVVDDDMGSLEDSRMSAAILMAPVMRPGFNGKIEYSGGNRPGTAKKIRGDVSVYATGVRNSFGLEFHSSGVLYATDNGGNRAFGDRSMGCSSSTKAKNEDDKLLKLRKGGFYGYGNRIRGGRECRHYFAEERGNYDAPIETMEAATTGIMEYTANTFGGLLRGNLMLGQIATRKSNGKLYRIQLAKDGTVTKKFVLNSWSGADIALSGEGHLIMARVYQSSVGILKAVETDPGIVVVTSVWPFRGGKSGGNEVTVTGWGFKNDVQIFMGGKPCKVVWRKGRNVRCVVPPGVNKVPVIARSGGRSSGTDGFEYMYMNVG